MARKLINFEFNANVAPTEFMPAFLTGLDSDPVVRLARFGISSPAAKNLGRDLILNTRVETARTGYYDWMLHSRRSITPADGFYEFR